MNPTLERLKRISFDLLPEERLECAEFFLLSIEEKDQKDGYAELLAKVKMRQAELKSGKI